MHAGARARAGLDLDRAPGLVDHAVDRGQPQPGAARALGGEERLEHAGPGGLVHARAAVGHGDLHRGRRLPRRRMLAGRRSGGTARAATAAARRRAWRRGRSAPGSAAPGSAARGRPPATGAARPAARRRCRWATDAGTTSPGRPGTRRAAAAGAPPSSGRLNVSNCRVTLPLCSAAARIWSAPSRTSSRSLVADITWAQPSTTCRVLLKSWATPAASRPTASSFWLWNSVGLGARQIGLGLLAQALLGLQLVHRLRRRGVGLLQPAHDEHHDHRQRAAGAGETEGRQRRC